MSTDDCLIHLDGLSLPASIGIYPHEKAAPQPVDIDLRLAIDGTLAARSDDIRHTVDYDEVVDAIAALLASRHFNLLEHVSQAVLDLLGERFPVRRAEVTIAKPLTVPQTRRVSVSRSAEWKREAMKVMAV